MNRILGILIVDNKIEEGNMKRVYVLMAVIVSMVLISLVSFAEGEIPGGYNATITQNRSDEHRFSKNEYYFSIEFWDSTGGGTFWIEQKRGDGGAGYGGNCATHCYVTKYGQRTDVNWRLWNCNSLDNAQAILYFYDQGMRVPVAEIDLRTDSKDIHKHYMNFSTYQGGSSKYNISVQQRGNAMIMYISERKSGEEGSESMQY